MAKLSPDPDNKVIHPFKPVFAPDSRILILGTMPSRLSRQNGFYYGHPQNRFWVVLATLLSQAVPIGNVERRTFLLQNKIALWDVLQQCEIEGSQDVSIRKPVANDMAWLLQQCPIKQIFTNGQAATKLYQKWCQPQTGRPCIGLPSTSPANAQFSLTKLCDAWRPILAFYPETLQPEGVGDNRNG